MENIFENAYFGKEYKTRDGRKALFHRNANNRTWYLITEDINDRIPYNADGTCVGDSCHDIVSEWEEPINEDKLDRFANKKLLEEIKIAKQSESLGQCYGVDFVSGFKAGYKAAKKENIVEEFEL